MGTRDKKVIWTYNRQLLILMSWKTSVESMVSKFEVIAASVRAGVRVDSVSFEIDGPDQADPDAKRRFLEVSGR
jgi:hypothetical protein